MFPLANGETVVRQRASLVADPYSGESTKRDWSSPDELELVGTAIAPSSSTEPVSVDRQQVITSMSLYCGAGSDVLPEDRIRARSGLWQVEGEVGDWRNPFTGWAPGAEFRVKKVAG